MSIKELLQQKLKEATANPEMAEAAHRFATDPLIVASKAHARKAVTEVAGHSKRPKLADLIGPIQMKILYRQFKDQIKALGLSLNDDHKLSNEKLEMLRANKSILKEPNGKEQMESMLGIQIRIRSDADLIKDRLPPEPKVVITAKTQPKLLAIQSQDQLTK